MFLLGYSGIYIEYIKIALGIYSNLKLYWETLRIEQLQSKYTWKRLLIITALRISRCMMGNLSSQKSLEDIFCINIHKFK